MKQKKQRKFYAVKPQTVKDVIKGLIPFCDDKIALIKMARNLTDLSLVECKEMVEDAIYEFNDSNESESAREEAEAEIALPQVEPQVNTQNLPDRCLGKDERCLHCGETYRFIPLASPLFKAEEAHRCGAMQADYERWRAERDAYHKANPYL